MVKRIEVSGDVLIVGGGAAGGMAGILAAEAGAKVLMVDLARMERSGDVGAGNDHLAAYLNSGGDWDTKEVFLAWYLRLSQYLIDANVAEKTNVSLVPEMIARLEKMGVPLKDPKTGKYIRTMAFDQPASLWINFNGIDLKPLMIKEARRLGAQQFHRVMICDLLYAGEKVIGAVGFGIRTGDFYVFKAKNTILSTGPIQRLWENPTPYMFNTWHGPYCGAAAFHMALNSGAEFANVEIATNNVVVKGFNTPGYNGMMCMGARVINALGEQFLQKYHPRGEKGPKWAVCWGIYQEKMAGRGPCYFDVRHLTPEAMEHLEKNLLPVDKLTYMDYVRQKGLDLRKDLLELDLSEMALTGVTGDPSGILMDERCWTGVEGLYTAGTCAVPAYALMGALTTGICAGREAARETLSKKEKPVKPSVNAIRRAEQEIYAPLKRKKGIPWQEFELKRQKTMSRYVGIGRTEQGMLTAAEELKKLDQTLQEIKVNNLHELMRANEARHLLEASKLVTRSALERKESRFGHGHWRGDYPETREEWHGSVIVRKAGDGFKVRFKKADVKKSH